MTNKDLDTFLAAARSAIHGLLDEHAGGDKLAEGVLLADLAEDLAAYAATRVRMARRANEDLTWQAVGDAFGVTRQAAQQRFG